jgi:superfamily II DNA or RNA helicase
MAYLEEKSAGEAGDIREKLLSGVYALRRWQREALSFVAEHFETSDHVYVVAPTASGKSYFMFHAIEQLPGDVHVICVGMSNIVDQHLGEFRKYGCVDAVDVHGLGATLITPEGKTAIINTWQGLGSKMPDVAIASLTVDEIHLGGSGEKSQTLPNIRKNFKPKKRIFVSATIQTVSENNLGAPIKANTYVYKMSEAMLDDILQPVDLVEVQTGTRLKFERDVAAIEAETGEDIEVTTKSNARAKTKVIVGDDLEDAAAQMRDEYCGHLNNRINDIVKHRHEAMMQVYLAKHCGQQALFFCPRVGSEGVYGAKDAAARFNSLARRTCVRAGKKTPRAASIYANGMPEGEIATTIAEFKAGNIEVLFVVGMLQEGFDHAPLALAFDCRFYRRWTPARVARMTQKIGRIMRKDKSKVGSSLYYYARDITDFYDDALMRSKTPGHPALDDDASNLFDGETVADLADVKDAAGAAAALIKSSQEGSSGTDDVEVNESDVEMLDVDDLDDEVEDDVVGSLDDAEESETIETAEVKTKRIRMVKTPLWRLKSVHDHVIVRRFSFALLFKKKLEVIDRFDYYMDLLVAGTCPTPTQRGGTTEQSRFYAFLSSLKNPNKANRPDLYDLLVAENSMCKIADWFDRTEKRFHDYMAMLDAGTCPTPTQRGGTTEQSRFYAFLSSLKNPNKANRPDLYDLLVAKNSMCKIADWFDRTEKRFHDYMAMLDAGTCPTPKQRGGTTEQTQFYRFLIRLKSPKATNRPDLYDLLVAKNSMCRIADSFDRTEKRFHYYMAMLDAGTCPVPNRGGTTEQSQFNRFLSRLKDPKQANRPDLYDLLVAKNSMCQLTFDRTEKRFHYYMAMLDAGTCPMPKRGETTEQTQFDKFLSRLKSPKAANRPDLHDRLTSHPNFKK